MEQEIYQNARIMVVDDEAPNVMVVEHMLEEWGYTQVRSTTNSQLALALYQEFEPHIVLLDLMMPKLDGFAVMRQLRAATGDRVNPAILVLTADVSTQTKRQALDSGAQDFLTKPFDAIELSLRLSNLLQINFLYSQQRDLNRLLEERVVERTAQLSRSEHETAICLGIAGEYRDDDTGRHTQRVGATAAILARESRLWTGSFDLIQQAAPLHDVGKIGVPDSILLKPGRLTPEEFDVIKRHCQIGQGILSNHHTSLLQLASNIAISHHERWDGNGYPNKLAGEDIPLEGRIVAVADVFDALTHARPYKEAWPVEKAVDEIQAQSGRQFDPVLVEAFVTHLDQIVAIREEEKNMVTTTE